MADSDGEYVGDLSDDDLVDHTATQGGTADASGNYGTRSKDASGGGGGKQKKGKGKGDSRKAWEDIQRSWEGVGETADGNIAIGERFDAEKRRRLLRDTTPLQRGIIRHLMLVLDMSFAMSEKDLLPSRYLLTLHYAVDFVREYFEQNPISQMGVVGMRDGVAVRISDMSGNPAEHIEKLREWAEQQEPQGNPSLQNALEMCRGALFHAPSHGTREVLIIYGALLSSDPGDIHDTIASLIADRIRVSVVGLAAQVAICAELCARTNGDTDTDTSSSPTYAVALHEQHFRELFLAATTPPVTRSSEQHNASLLMMGFPSRTLVAPDHISLCACHNRPSREGYACTRCRAKVCRLPVECPACGLTLILSTHLARSYHHLFPLRNWVEVSWAEAAKRRETGCHSCLAPFPAVPGGRGGKEGRRQWVPEVVKGVSESGRYACQVCGNHFCIDCDVFSHEILHNCPGCQSDTRGATLMAVEEAVAAAAAGEALAAGAGAIEGGSEANGGGLGIRATASMAMVVDG
ncbi:putative transcription factor [Bombardia bombarda]|uniref:General transcription and DNA repair factor IIH n=1 Tax=Bombardia bombarda TaxID=252184 RepID=A0AA40CEU7_9PEZI|nr:putative transcription factor [Bombardia bombarda]